MLNSPKLDTEPTPQATDALAQWQRLQHGLAEYEARWLTGASCQALATLVPHAAAPSDSAAPSDAASLQALAFYSQLHLFNKPNVASSLTPVAALPTLSMPCLPLSCRPAFRALLRELAQTPSAVDLLIKQLVQRGVAPHPADWLPSASDQHLPDSLAPWLAVVRGESQRELDQDNWADFSLNRRLQLFKQLRQRHPQQASALLLQCIEQEPAQQRLSYLELLQHQLSVSDEPLLRQGLQDRALHVKQRCYQFLVQLGLDAQDPSADAAVLQELTACFSHQGRGLFSAFSQKQWLFSLPNNSVQADHLLKALASVSLPTLASALGISVDSLLTQWAFDQNQGDGAGSPNIAFVHNACRYLTAAQCQQFLHHIIKTYASSVPLGRLRLANLFARLPPAQQQDAMQLLLMHFNAEQGIQVLLDVFAEPWTSVSPTVYQRSPLQRHLAGLFARLSSATSQDPTSHHSSTQVSSTQASTQVSSSQVSSSQVSNSQAVPPDTQLEHELQSWLRWLGLLLPKDTATLLLQAALKAGIAPTSPWLETLNFQLSLPEGHHDE